MQLTIFLDSTEPPAGTLRSGHDAEGVAFVGWVSLIGAIKTITAGGSDRSSDESMNKPTAWEDPTCTRTDNDSSSP